MIAESLTYILKNFLEVFTIIFILHNLIGYTYKINRIGIAICSVVTAVWSVLPYFLINDTLLAVDIVDFSTSFAAIFIPYCVLQRRKRFTFFWFSVAVLFIADLFETVVVTLTDVESIVLDNLIYVGFSVVSLVLLNFLVRKKNFSVPVDFIEQLPKVLYIAILISSLATYYTSMLPKDSEFSGRISQILLVLASATTMLCVFYILSRYMLVSQKQQESQHQLDLQLSYYENMAEKNQDMRAFRHDFDNNMYALNELIEDNQFDEAKKYILDLTKRTSLTKPKYSTGNRLANAIISHKAEESEKLGIEIDFKGTVPADKVSNSDICTILSNALDNAIRATAEIAPCKIKIRSYEKASAVTITISNPVKEKVEIRSNSIKTTKANKKNHGFGISNIKRAAEKNGGFVELMCDDNEFTIKIGLIYGG